jgi:type IV pilus assembly protein PilW
MNRKIDKVARGHSGFTLVEIMVGLAIGMLATIVIIQVISVFEAQKRVTTGTSDAQTNGSIALHNIVREMGLAGYPLMPITNSPLECTTVTYGATGIGSISPITITDGASGVSDTITIRYGDTTMGGVPTEITGNGASANERTVNNNFGCQTNDVVLISNGSTCALTTATALSAASASPATITLQDTTNAAAGGNLACLGVWNEISYAVNSGNLEREGIPAIAGIMNLQAQYGISAAATSNQVTEWVDATGAWVNPTVANRNRIKAVRLAVVARNDKLEASNVTTTINAWTGSASSPAPAIDLSSDPNWRRYRYRVFETIVPLRNVIWAKDTL